MEKRKDVPSFTQSEFLDNAVKLYGKDSSLWKFVCPICKIETTVQQWKDAGAPEGAIGFSCIGRYVKSTGNIGNKKQPCDYTMGGLLVFPGMYVDDNPYFLLVGIDTLPKLAEVEIEITTEP